MNYSKLFPTLEPPSALLVVGGGKATVELVDLTDGGAESCISPVRALNYKKNSAAIWIDDNPTVCGGGDSYSYDYSDKCASYDMNEGKWAPYNILPETRLDKVQRLAKGTDVSVLWSRGQAFWAKITSNQEVFLFAVSCTTLKD